MLSSSYGVFTWALEGTYGTDAVDALIAADSAIVYQEVNSGSSITPTSINFRPDRYTPGQNNAASSFIKQFAAFSLQVPCKAGIGTTNVPAASALLQACGFVEAVGVSSTTYTLDSVMQPGFSLWHWKPVLNTANHRLIRTYGALGNLSLSGAVGEEVVYAAEGNGIGYHDWSASSAFFSAAGNPILDSAGAASTSTATMDTSERLLCRSATITYNSVTMPVSTWSIDVGLGVEVVQTQNAATVGARVVRSGRDAATVSLSLEGTDALAAYDKIRTDSEANTVANLVLVMTGATRKLTITARVQFQPRPTERENAGQVGWDATAILVDNLSTHPFGDNSLTLLFETI